MLMCKKKSMVPLAEITGTIFLDNLAYVGSGTSDFKEANRGCWKLSDGVLDLLRSKHKFRICSMYCTLILTRCRLVSRPRLVIATVGKS